MQRDEGNGSSLAALAPPPEIVAAASTRGGDFHGPGDAEIHANAGAIGYCMAPVVLLRIFNASAPPGSQLGPCIALNGF